LLGGAAAVADNDDGYIFIAFRPDLLVPLTDLKRELSGADRQGQGGAAIARLHRDPDSG